jgi:hypothetical protein
MFVASFLVESFDVPGPTPKNLKKCIPVVLDFLSMGCGHPGEIVPNLGRGAREG